MTSPPASPHATNPSPEWAEAELVNPHQSAEKAGKVRRMFAAIAGSYDLNNHVHSLWRDQAWRRYAVRSGAVQPGQSVLDVACGTGDLTQAFATTAASRVVGLDFTREMLDIARQKQTHRPAEQAGKITYVEGDAQHLPFRDGEFDVVSIAFGIRNVADPALAIREFFRVLRPGGRVIVLEFDRPRCSPVRWFNDFYCGWVMPRTATLISGDRSGAYRYLPKSVGTFMARHEMVKTLTNTGFANVTDKSLSLGICVCYRGERPAR
jgi:demethylmenaquinone methyltransferase/2-methoxy-6-polyprenyl-1,4-benzoquinol methylase